MKIPKSKKQNYLGPASQSQIKEFLGDGKGSCKVRIQTGGYVYCWGSTVISDISRNCWTSGGMVGDYFIDDKGNIYVN